jgi:hypothetical protein
MGRDSWVGLIPSTLVNIVHSKINAETTTWAAMLKALNLFLSKFAFIQDGITAEEISQHKSGIKVRKKNTPAKLSKKKK